MVRSHHLSLGAAGDVLSLIHGIGGIANLVVAPQLVGLVSDALQPRFGTESLRLALLPLTLCGFWAAAHFWIVVQRSPRRQAAAVAA
jgi:hypothetical protein